MAEKNNATCSICGNPYYLCMSCRDFIKLQPWKIHCCSAECFKAFQVVKGFSTGIYTKDEFKSKLKSLDLNNLENYKDNIKQLIKNTLKEEVPESVIKTESIIIEKEEDSTIPMMVGSRKKKYKVEIE